ncbi:hypothetical protein BLNAU_16802 [Blattamonas nauphoetae]|uniref:Uncharacterized protein n=1 Tax=Blattamonas nauphoetae TaxID=2049346 RepID=A0ABQ9XD85_9EUKA|nr:hypothetical protein BLNAU_16802 [Blattamonas nauphoetae]
MSSFMSPILSFCLRCGLYYRTNAMLIDKTSVHTDIDAEKAKQTNFLEMFLTQISGKYNSLRPMTLNDLLAQVIESDWALSTILEVEYIKPLEEYCEKTQPCDVPLCFSPQLEVSTIALKVLTTRCKSDSETRSFLRTLKVPSGSTDSSSELVPFAGRLCSTLAEHVSEMKTLFTESSPLDGTISALSTSLPDDSPLLAGNTVLELLCEELTLLNSLLPSMLVTFQDILIDFTLVHPFKSTIIFCLNLLENEKNESVCPPSSRTGMLIHILDCLWYLAACCICHKPLNPVIESTVSDVPQLCSLLERTSRHSSPTHFSHLTMIINIGQYLPRLLPRMLEENLVENVINTSRPMPVQTTTLDFHHSLIRTLTKLIDRQRSIHRGTDRKRARIFLLERVLQPAKQYLQFILQREEFNLSQEEVNLRREEFFQRPREIVPNFSPLSYYEVNTIAKLLRQTLTLERDLFEDGEIVETGREEWEVVLLVEKTNENDLGMKLELIRQDDGRMKRSENERWRKRVERLREAGHEDAMEGWLTRRDKGWQSRIGNYLRHVRNESGMNSRRWRRWPDIEYWM